ncbi:MAG: AMP-binding protein [Acidimicrobiia bacterium]
MRADLEWGTIPNLMLRQAERYGDTEALFGEDRSWSYRQLRDAMLEAATATIALGIDRGDRVAIWAPNSAQWVIGALGALAAGAILVPINTRFVGDEAAFVIAKSGARALFTVGEFAGHDYLSALRAADPTLPALERVVMLDDAARPGSIGWSTFMASAEGRNVDQALARIAAIEPDDISDLMFTSGTTGKPKGVMLSHSQSLRAFGAYASQLDMQPGERAGIIPPFFHCFGSKGGWLAMLIVGGSTVPIPVLDPDDLVRRIEELRLVFIPGPPTVHYAYLDHPRRHEHDLSSLRAAMLGATSIPSVLVERLRSELHMQRALTGFGLTESTAMVSIASPNDSADVLANTVGKPLEGVEVEIRGDDGQVLGNGERGEVVVRGYNVMRGYWDEPELTAEAIDADGWLHTGDIGMFDPEGNLQIVDRKKDMVIVGGFNVYPAEVEAVLRGHEAVEQVAVIAIPDARMGEVPAAYIVTRSGATLDEASFTAWCRERMANFKVPRRVAIVDALPMNASMKVKKNELRADAAQRWSSSA